MFNIAHVLPPFFFCPWLILKQTRRTIASAFVEQLTLHVGTYRRFACFRAAESVRSITLWGEGYVVSAEVRGDVRHMQTGDCAYLKPS
jgi:hypothetical protein